MIREATSYRSTVVEDLLGRYGLAYVCQNPAVLFSDYVVALGDQSRGTYRPASASDTGKTGYVDRRGENLAHRVSEAYEILDALRAPWPAEYGRSSSPPYGLAHSAYQEMSNQVMR